MEIRVGSKMFENMKMRTGKMKVMFSCSMKDE